MCGWWTLEGSADKLPTHADLPRFQPRRLSLGPLKIHWYGITYLVGFLGCYLAARTFGPKNPVAAGLWNS